MAYRRQGNHALQLAIEEAESHLQQLSKNINISKILIGVDANTQLTDSWEYSSVGDRLLDPFHGLHLAMERQAQLLQFAQRWQLKFFNTFNEHVLQGPRATLIHKSSGTLRLIDYLLASEDSDLNINIVYTNAKADHLGLHGILTC